jgi:cell wall-associated NlpC family hydrolase
VVSQLRSLLLALVLAVSAVLGPDPILAARTKAQRSHRHRALWLGVQRAHRLRLAALARPTPLGVLAARLARRFLGVPYVWGGSSPGGFDCSGLVRYVYGRLGIDLPHSSYADFGLGRRVARRALQPGDLVFFDGVGHVGLYIGHGRFIHAPHSGTRVRISTLAEYGGSYDGARRIVAGARRVLLGRR